MLRSTVFLPLLLCLGVVVASQDSPLSSREIAREFRETLKKFKSSDDKVRRYFFLAYLLFRYFFLSKAEFLFDYHTDILFRRKIK